MLNFKRIKEKDSLGISLVVQWLRLHTFNAGATGSIPSRGTKVPHASWHSQKIKRPQIWQSKCSIGIL